MLEGAVILFIGMAVGYAVRSRMEDRQVRDKAKRAYEKYKNKDDLYSPRTLARKNG